jgi:hypothetical protein
MATEAFYPVSNSYALDVTTTSQALVPVISPVPSGPDIATGGFEYRFTVVGTQPVFISDAYPDEAAPTAVYPTTGTNQNGVLVLPGTIATFKFVYGTKLSVIAPATGSTIHVCIGRGINV